MPLTLVPQYPYMYLLSLAPDLSLFEVFFFKSRLLLCTLRSNGVPLGINPESRTVNASFTLLTCHTKLNFAAESRKSVCYRFRSLSS